MSTSSRPELIGLAGTFVGGKDTLANHLEAEYGFSHVSTGDMVREIAMREEGSIERPVLKKVADAYRHTMGAGAFVLMALDKPRPLVVTGLRSLGEARALKDAGGFLLFIDAPLEVRYKRMLARARDSETNLAIEEFAAGEMAEWHSGDDEADFNLRDIKIMADSVFDNNFDNIDDFYEAALRLLSIR